MSSSNPFMMHHNELEHVSDQQIDTSLEKEKIEDSSFDHSIGKGIFIPSMRLFLRMIFGTVLIGLVGIVGVFYLSQKIIADLPSPETLSDPRTGSTYHIYAQGQESIGLRGSHYLGEVTIDDVSQHLIHAILSIEDHHFYDHLGFDPIGIIRAFWVNMTSGHMKQGASTITQQLAKNAFVGSEKSYLRKFKELLYALRLEQAYSKDRILEIYMNRVYLGSGLYGVKAAAEHYFSKSPQDLTIAESAVIAGLLKAPSRYAPTYHPQRAHDRADIVIKAMFNQGYISQEEYQTALSAPATFNIKHAQSEFGYVADRIAHLVPLLLKEVPKDVIVHTSIHPTLQKNASKAVEEYINTYGKDKKISQAAYIALNDEGGILAMVGGKSYKETPFNRTTHAFRQSGSAFKPFIYATAFERGYHPDTYMVDRDVSFKGYRPQNYKNKYMGRMTLRTAFARSINTIAVTLAHQIGTKNVRQTAYNAGILSPMHSYLSMALGSFEVSPLELTASYIPFFNEGYRTRPHLIHRIEDNEGNILYQMPQKKKQKIFRTQTTHFMKNIFQAVTQYGTGRRAALDNIPTFGKTGTTSSYKDAWFIGHAGHKNGITAGIWLGNDNDGNTNKATGGNSAAVLWHEILSHYFSKHPRDPKDDLIPQKTTNDPIFNILQHIQKHDGVQKKDNINSEKEKVAPLEKESSQQIEQKIIAQPTIEAPEKIHYSRDRIKNIIQNYTKE